MPTFEKTVDVPDDEFPTGEATFYVDAEYLDADESGPAGWVVYELRLVSVDKGDADMFARQYGYEYVRTMEAAALEEYDGEGY